MQIFPFFSRAQLGIILLVGAVLFFLYGWRANFGRTPAMPPTVALKPIFVEVAGDITRPGVYSFPGPPTLPEVWRQAGGRKPPPPSDLKLTSGSRLEVTPQGTYRLGRMSGPRLLTLGLGLDLNTATAEDLEALPGLGPALARRIVAHRAIHGQFRKLKNLLKVSGIGAKKLEALRPFVNIKKPISIPPGGE